MQKLIALLVVTLSSVTLHAQGMKKYILAAFFAALSGVPSRNSFLLSNF